MCYAASIGCMVAVCVLFIIVVAIVVIIVKLNSGIKSKFTAICGTNSPRLSSLADKQRGDQCITELLDHASMAYTLYCRPPVDDSWVPDGCVLACVFPSRQGYILFCRAAPLYIISFRGTFNSRDILTDLDARYSKLSWLENGSIPIHKGFDKNYTQVRQQIHSTVPRGASVFVTGHSLGASLGVLCAIDMKVHKDPSMLTCTVFACPKIGGSTFRDTCSPLLRDTLTTLVTNLADAVPVSPVGIYDKYFHLEQTPHTNGMRQLSGIHLLAFRLDKGKWIENHSLDTYAEYAERLTVTTTAASSSLFV